MAQINPITFLSRLQQSKKETPQLVQEALKESHLEEINQENLLKGLDSQGNEMPYYSSQSEYGYEKFRRNPNNGGRWDLRNTGEYHKGIFAKVEKSNVFFRQRYNNEKVRWLDMMLDKANRNPLGMTDQQFYDVQLKNKPKIKVKIENILNGTS